jgi:hypothetical protein
MTRRPNAEDLRTLGESLPSFRYLPLAIPMRNTIVEVTVGVKPQHHK